MHTFISVLLGVIIGSASMAYAQGSPGDLLRNLNRPAPAQTPQAPAPSSSALPESPPAGMGQTPGHGSAFDRRGFRQPDMMSGFYHDRPEDVKGGTEEQVRLFIIHLVGAASMYCPNVDARIKNSIINSTAYGKALRDPNEMANLGIQHMMNMLMQMRNPGAAIQEEMDDSVWEGDAKADMNTFLGRHGCTEEMNNLLRNAAKYFENPPSVARREREKIKASVLSSCESKLDEATTYCRCAVDALEAVNLSSEDWKAVATSFTAVTEVRADRAALRTKLRQCRN